MSDPSTEYEFGTGERGKYARRRPPRDGEIVRLILVARLTWQGAAPVWPASGAMTALCGGFGAMLTQKAENVVVIDFSHPDRATTALAEALQLGEHVAIQRDEHNGAAEIRAIHRLTARAGAYVGTVETLSATAPEQAALDRLSDDLSEWVRSA